MGNFLSKGFDSAADAIRRKKEELERSKLGRGVQQVYDVAVKNPTQATQQAISQGSVKPLVNNVQDTFSAAGKAWDTNVAQPITKAVEGAGQAISDPFQGINDYFKNLTAQQNKPINWTVQKIGLDPKFTSGLGLTGGPDWTASNASAVGENETAPDTSALNARFNVLSNLAKMREGSALQGEQSALNRRLASQNMLGSGAGMRMGQATQQQSNRRLADANLALSADSLTGTAAAQEAMNQRNMGRQQMRFSAAESSSNRQQQKQALEQSGAAAAAEFELNTQIANQNMEIARQTQEANQRGLLNSLFPFLGNMTAGLGKNNFINQMMVGM